LIPLLALVTFISAYILVVFEETMHLREPKPVVFLA
jgi:hypothetical protein